MDGYTFRDRGLVRYSLEKLGMKRRKETEMPPDIGLRVRDGAGTANFRYRYA